MLSKSRVLPRVSTNGQTLASQDAQLHAAGAAKVYAEKMSGARTDRPELAKLLKRLDAGDVLLVTRLDRLAASGEPDHGAASVG
jgi:DNA invertase Pin-like site-specific DNA recombinase